MEAQSQVRYGGLLFWPRSQKPYYRFHLVATASFWVRGSPSTSFMKRRCCQTQATRPRCRGSVRANLALNACATFTNSNIEKPCVPLLVFPAHFIASAG